MITVQNLTKSYGQFAALNDVSFTCHPGQVTGFLGPNGAGKSTAMRILCGLTPPDSGRAVIGATSYNEIPNPGTQVGVLLDASAQHGGRTGREILTLGQRTMGLPKQRVDEMLELVGLTPDEAKRRVRNYSLGMRQRLGLAHALLGDPSVLILDEPANGLDPAGIRWMRGLLRAFAEKGGTVLLSSHLLSEIQIIADEIVVIGNGRIVAQGSKDSLLQGTGTYVRAADHAALVNALTAAGVTTTAADRGVIANAEPAMVGQVAASAQLALVELRPSDGAGLENLFLQLTADNQRDDASAVVAQGAHA